MITESAHPETPCMSQTRRANPRTSVNTTLRQGLRWSSRAPFLVCLEPPTAGRRIAGGRGPISKGAPTATLPRLWVQMHRKTTAAEHRAPAYAFPSQYMPQNSNFQQGSDNAAAMLPPSFGADGASQPWAAIAGRQTHRAHPVTQPRPTSEVKLHSPAVASPQGAATCSTAREYLAAQQVGKLVPIPTTSNT
jgi:hypothetical protein